MLWTATILTLLSLPPAAADGVDEILAAAIKVQTPSGAVPAIMSYHADYEVSLHEDDKGNATPKRSGTIEQWWQVRNEKVRYHRVFRSKIGTAAPAHYITDGDRFWFQVEGERVQSMDDPTLRDDLENLRAEIRRTSELMQLFFIANILDPSAKATLAEGAKDVDDPKSRRRGDRIAVHEVTVTREGKRTVTLRIGKKDHLVYEAELGPHGGQAVVERFAFGYHRRLKDALIGDVVIPTRVTYSKNEKIVMEANVPLPAEEHIRFNTPLSRRLFQPLK